MASTFASSLELVRQGQVELRQIARLRAAVSCAAARPTAAPPEIDVRRNRRSTAEPSTPEIAERHLRILEALLFASAEPLARRRTRTASRARGPTSSGLLADARRAATRRAA